MKNTPMDVKQRGKCCKNYICGYEKKINGYTHTPHLILQILFIEKQHEANLEPIIQSEVSEKDKYHIIMHIYGI